MVLNTSTVLELGKIQFSKFWW